MSFARTRLGALVLLASPAAAQTVTHFQPDVWRGEEGARVTLSPRADQRVAKWADRPFEWLFVRGAGSQTNHDALPRPAERGKAPTFTFHAAKSDTWIAGLDLAPRIETVRADDWVAFGVARLAPGARPAARAAGDELVRIQRRESTKTLVVVRDARGRSGSSGTPMGKTGQRMEIRPLVDPCIATPGSALPVRLYVPPGVPLAQRLTALQLESGERVHVDLDAKGFGHVVLPSAGPWRLEVHAARRAGEDAAFDWTLHSTTLAFEAPPRPPAEKPTPPKNGPTPAGKKGGKR